MATPKLALIPTGYKAGKVYSVLPESGVGDFTFTRASEATRINSAGLLEVEATGVPRLEYPLIDGVVNGCPSLLLENQATNLITYPVSFDNAYWTKAGATIDDNAGAGYSSPSVDFPTSAFKLVEGTNTGGHNFRKNSLAVTLTNTYMFSIIAKKGERDWIMLRDDLHEGVSTTYFDLTNGVVGTTNSAYSKIEALGDGFYRCSTSTVSTHVSSTIYPAIHLAEADNDITYTGDGTSGVYLFMAQLEQGSYATSPTLTSLTAEGTTTTRVAEVCNGAGDASTFNDSEGVLMVEGSLLDVSQDFDKISISDGSSAENRIEFIYLNDNEIKVEIGLTNGFNETLNVGSSESFNKIAVVYNSTNASVFINGFNLVTDTMSSLSGLSQLQFNRFNSNIENFYGKTKQIQYFNTVLTDAELETLTSWTSFTAMANAQQYNII